MRAARDKAPAKAPAKKPARLLPAGLLAALLAGCHGAADYRAVELEKQRPVLRGDQFQGAAANDKVAVAVGGATVVVSTLDGRRQSRVALPGAPALIDVAACPDGSFVALDFYRKVWVADAAGAGWSARELKTSARPLGLTCDGANRYWMVGSGSTVASSADRGASWSEQNFGDDAMFNTIQFVDAEAGFILGEFGAVLSTRDGGANWSKGAPIPNDFYPYAALFTSRDVGYAAGLTGTMLRTGDGGKSWRPLANPGALPQYRFAAHGGQLYSVGAEGSLLRLDGDGWRALDYGAPAPAHLRGVAGAGAGALMLAGGAGALRFLDTASAVAAK